MIKCITLTLYWRWPKHFKKHLTITNFPSVSESSIKECRDISFWTCSNSNNTKCTCLKSKSRIKFKNVFTFKINPDMNRTSYFALFAISSEKMLLVKQTIPSVNVQESTDKTSDKRTCTRIHRANCEQKFWIFPLYKCSISDPKLRKAMELHIIKKFCPKLINRNWSRRITIYIVFFIIRILMVMYQEKTFISTLLLSFLNVVPILRF